MINVVGSKKVGIIVIGNNVVESKIVLRYKVWNYVDGSIILRI